MILPIKVNSHISGIFTINKHDVVFGEADIGVPLSLLNLCYKMYHPDIALYNIPYFDKFDLAASGNVLDVPLIVKGHKACPICESDTCYHQLDSGKKTVYLEHQKFINLGHPYRRLQNAFNGEKEFTMTPKPLTEDEVY
ncbi:unnamed protein product [Vicia faba]|uniref:Uncharacterized protein n=1 Tax=Vicia faba TaxID=3906 RepID=A0AAV0YQA5_VICFA|nr:unnamed protein product [Vicia faba]